MKKYTYFISLILVLVLSSISCSKEDDQPTPQQTLEQKYPDWKNLTWVSTDGVTTLMNPDVYPRLNITITDDEGFFCQPYSSSGNYQDTFAQITISGNTITFGAPANVVGTFTKSGDKITLTTKGLTITSHTYVLQIN